MRWTITFVATLLAFPVSGFAGGPPAAGHVSTTGTVRMNSSLLPSGSAIYPGDVIATGEDGIAIVTSKALGRLEVRPSSNVQFTANQVTLRDGAVALSSSAVTLGEYRIEARSPEAAGNWFAVASKNGRKVVAAHRGDVLIARSGAALILVPAGFYAVTDQAEEQGGGKPKTADATAEGQKTDPKPDDKTDDDDDDDDGAVVPTGKSTGKGTDKAAGKTAGQKTAEAAAKTAGWTIGSLSHAASVAVVTTVVAAAATATTVGIALNDEPVSPTN